MARTRVRWDRVVVVLGALVALLWGAGRALGEAATAPGARYRVEAGDTLWAIARREVGPTGDPRPVVADIREANGLTTSALRPGQTLALPAT
jgi:Tfp pilus assembly protein FimV